jgi:hypothetical protein
MKRPSRVALMQSSLVGKRLRSTGVFDIDVSEIGQGDMTNKVSCTGILHPSRKRKDRTVDGE